MEQWKQYKNSNYEISTLGEVRNIKTKKILKQHKKYNGRIENDYMRVSLVINNKKVKKSIHRLVAECFLENYSEELEVNHKNNIRYDNRLENLEMCTREYNHNYSVEKGYGIQKRPVYAIGEDGRKHEFNGLWAASKFINEQRGVNYNLNHVCNCIKYAINDCKKTAYGFKWYDSNK